MIGQTVSRYRITDKLGEGGMGEVYLAEDLSLDRKVALKFLPEFFREHQTARKRFTREAKSAAALDHPFICNIHEVAETDEGQDFIVMEYVEGQTLRERMSDNPLSLPEVLQVAVEVAEALEVAHEKGVVHRDLKPANIMLTPQGHAKVMDFGVAKRLPTEGRTEQDVTSTLTREGTALGTLAYMSPEQVRGLSVEARSDIFSFGVVLYEMITGIHPFRKPLPMDTATAIQTETPLLMSLSREGVPEVLERIVQKMLAKDPDRRYQSVRELLRDLIGLRQETGTTWAGAWIFGKQPFFSRPRTGLIVLAGILLLTLAVWNRDLMLPPESAVETDRRSVAVLPLQNLSADPENEYFSDGITEDIIAELSRIPDLKVISRTSVMQYKHRKKNLREIGQELGVATVLEGSVRRDDGQVRVVAQLVDAETDEHLWVETYDRDLTDIFEIQENVAREIGVALRARLSPTVRELVERRPTASFEAYNLYLRGRHFRNQETPAGFERAIDYFQQAIEQDPGYARAYAGLAEAYFGLGGFGGFNSVLTEKAVQAVERALQLDDSVPEAYVSLGMIRKSRYYHNDWAGAEAAFQQALKLNPRHSNAHREYGLLLFRQLGRFREAFLELSQAHALDPLSLLTNANLADVYRASGEFDRALAISRKMWELAPNSHWGYRYMGASYFGLAEHEKAQQQARNALAIQPDDFAGRLLALSSLYQGRIDQARQVAEALLASSPESPRNWVVAGVVALWTGEDEEARAHLENVVELAPAGVFLATVPVLRSSTLLGYLYQQRGEQVRAERMLAYSLRLDSEERIEAGEKDAPPRQLHDIAVVHAIRGQKEEAYRWLQRAIDAGWRYYDMTSKDLVWSAFRDEPRFRRLMAGMKADVDEMRRRVEAMEREWEPR